MQAIPKGPPAPLVRVTNQIRRGLAGAERAMVPAHIGLLEEVNRRWIGDALGAVTKLEVIESLADGPRDVDAVAAERSLDPAHLYRLLRALAREGYLEQDGRRFGLTSRSRPLLRAHPDSCRNYVLEVTGHRNHQLWARLPDAVQAGTSAWGAAFPEHPDLWALLDAQPAEHAIFHGAMAELSRDAAPVFARAWDFGAVGSVVDLGGGTGSLLATILTLHPDLSGVLVDGASVVEGAPEVLARFGVADRCAVVAADIVADDIPAGHDVYLAKNISHGFDDALLGATLGRWRRAMQPGARLLLIDVVVPEAGPYFAYLDLQMLVGSGGKERTRAEFEAVLEAAGFGSVRVHDTITPFSIVEATAGGAA